MRVDEVPLPAAVAKRPRDERGYPVLAITPWSGGVPQFASTGTARTFICAVERRCSICGLFMESGPVWRVVSGAEAEGIEAARVVGSAYRNNAATTEAPGHRACMLYAAVVCPYLARPGARRGQDAVAAGLATTKGDRRGMGGAVAGFASMEFRLQETVLFRFADLIEFRPHELGEEQLAALIEAVAAEPSTTEQPPSYLLSDEEAAEARFAGYNTLGRGGPVHR